MVSTYNLMCVSTAMLALEPARGRFSKTLCCWLLMILTSLMLSGCGGGSTPEPINSEPPPPPPPYVYQQPELQLDQLQVAHFQDVGISDIQLLHSMMDKINQGQYRNIDSVLILKDNQLFFEENLRDSFDGADVELNNNNLDLHSQMSVTKSFVSALVGVAIDNGDIPNVDVPVHNYFEAWFPIEHWEDHKSEITLRHYLTMQHGYKGNDNVIYTMLQSKQDYVEAILDLEMEALPGEKYQYSTAVSHLIGAVVEQATGVHAIDYFNQYLFEPMGIEEIHWSTSPAGRPETGRGLFISNRSMAKFGLLFLNKGVWQDRRLLSEDWVNQSTQTYVSFEDRDFQTGYGWHWWTHEFLIEGQVISSYHAEGNGGQFIWVIDQLNAVVVFTGANYNSELSLQPYELMRKYVLPVLLQSD